MSPPGPGDQRRPLSLIWYLIGFIALIIGIVVAASLAISYLQAQDEILQDYAILQNNTENNAIESVWLVNTGLELVDEDLDPPLNASLQAFRDAYVRSGSDPSRMNLSVVRAAIAPAFTGEVNLYIFNPDGIIEYSTLPEVQGIDFRQYPDFYAALTRIRLGSAFAADPVVRSVQNASDADVKGTLRKFAYLPTPDHRYVLEIGVDSYEFTSVRSRLSYQQMAQRLLAINPDLLGIRIYDYYGNVAAQAGVPGVGGQRYAEQAVRDRAGFSITDAANGTRTRYTFVDLSDPSAASDNSVVVELRFSDSRQNTALANLVSRYLLVGFLAILMGIVLAYAIFRKLTGSIHAIVSDVEQIAAGDLTHAIRSVNTTEFAHLESSITTMIRKILDYTEELERKKAELQVAAEIQSSFLPKEIPRPAGFDLAAVSIPAREVGGDFYDVFAERDGRYALVIADVAGKGVPASLFMALSRTAVRIISRWERTAQRVLEGSNTIFIEDSGSASFVTVFYALLDGEHRTLTYVNAGHNPPLLRHADGTIEELMPTGPVIGLVDEPGYEEVSIALSPGDVLVMYTDGVTEAINEKEELFSDERLKDVIAKHYCLPADALVRAIHAAVESFCGTAPQFDDITIMVLKVE
jgi:serine phosphatase RsbU (regulator of sigma subunit)